MLPFLQQPINARKLLIYSDHSSQHPTNAAELTNATRQDSRRRPHHGLRRRRLWRRSAHGNAQGRRQAPHQLRGRSRARASPRPSAASRPSCARSTPPAASLTTKTRRRGDPHLHRPQRRPEGQDADHRAPAAPGLHAAQSEARREDRRPPTASKSPLAAGATQEFAVNEERVFDQSYAGDQPHARHAPDLRPEPQPERRRAAGNCSGSPTRSRRSPTTTASSSRPRRRRATSTADEDRIRRNIQSLNAVSGQQQQVQTYARQFDQHEQQLAALRDRQSELQKQKAALQAELDRLIEALSF